MSGAWLTTVFPCSLGPWLSPSSHVSSIFRQMPWCFLQLPREASAGCGCHHRPLEPGLDVSVHLLALLPPNKFSLAFLPSCPSLSGIHSVRLSKVSGQCCCSTEAKYFCPGPAQPVPPGPIGPAWGLAGYGHGSLTMAAAFVAFVTLALKILG